MSELQINNNYELVTNPSAANGIEGLTPEDVKDHGVSLAPLKLVGQMSKEGKEDPSLIGKLLYDKRLDLGTELSTIVLACQWRWAEQREYNPTNPTPANIMTNDEFLSSGLDKDQVKRIAIVNLAIVLPEGVTDESSISAGGREYVLASFWARGFSLDFAKTLARRVGTDYEGASYNKVTKLVSGTRKWKGETMRLVKWGGLGPAVSDETLNTLAEEIGGLG